MVHEHLAAVRVWGTYLEDSVEVKNCATAQYRCGTDVLETAIHGRKSGTSDGRDA